MAEKMVSRAKVKDLVLSSNTKHLIHFNKKKIRYVDSYAGELANLLLELCRGSILTNTRMERIDKVDRFAGRERCQII